MPLQVASGASALSGLGVSWLVRTVTVPGRDHRLVSKKDQELEQTPELENRSQVPVDPGRHFPVTCVPYNLRRVRHRTVDRVRNTKTTLKKEEG
jgi:hypothetical protein